MAFRQLHAVSLAHARELEELAKAHNVLAQEHAQTRGLVSSMVLVLRRGFWGRLRWLLFGT